MAQVVEYLPSKEDIIFQYCSKSCTYINSFNQHSNTMG
jgi:hypothetical protein